MLKLFFLLCVVLLITQMQLFSIEVRAGDIPLTIMYDNFSDPNKNSLLRTSGDSTFNSDVLVVTGDNYSRSGSAFYNKQISLNNSGFSTYFVFNISDMDRSKYTADGICFVMKTDSSHANGTSGLGGLLGYFKNDQNIISYKNSIAIEFDIFDNSPYGLGTGDPGDITGSLTKEQIKVSGNHIAVHANGISEGKIATTLNNSTTMPDFKSGSDIHVWIDYNPSVLHNQLKIYTAYTNSRPFVPNLKVDINISSYLSTNDIFVGFTGATGAEGSALQVIKKWYFNNNFNSIILDGSKSYVMDTPPSSISLDDIVNVSKNCGKMKIKNWKKNAFNVNMSLLDSSNVSIQPEDPAKFLIAPHVDKQGYLIFKIVDGFSGLLKCNTKLLDKSDNAIVNATGKLYIDVSDFIEKVPLTNAIFASQLNHIVTQLKIPGISQINILDLILQYNKLLDKAPEALRVSSLSKIIRTIEEFQSSFLKDEKVIFELRNLASKIIEMTSEVSISSYTHLGKTGIVVDLEKADTVYTMMDNNLSVVEELNKIFYNINSLGKLESIMLFKIREGWKEEYSFTELPYEINRQIFSRGIENVMIKTSNATVCFKKNSISDVGIKTLMFESKNINSSITDGSNTIKKYDLNLFVDDLKLTILPGPISIHLPLLFEDENTEQNLTVIRENEDTTQVNMGGMYNRTFGRMVFLTNHLSLYFVRRINVGFSDTDSVDWASDFISALAAKGIVSGTGNNTFSPNSFIKREEFASMVVNAFNLVDTSAAANFSDLDKSQWYYAFVASAVKNGIMRGYNQQLFGVGDFVKKQDGATILANCLVKISKMTYPTYPQNIIDQYLDNNDITSYAIPSVALVTVGNVMKGDPTAKFLPLSNITRAQMATALFNALKLNSSQGLSYRIFNLGEYDDSIDVS